MPPGRLPRRKPAQRHTSVGCLSLGGFGLFG